MDFAPYQDTNPETTRALSPPLPSRRSNSFTPPLRTPPLPSPIPRPSNDYDRVSSPYQDQWPPTNSQFATNQNGGQQGDVEAGYFGGVGANRREGLEDFVTSLGIRMDYEACLAYLLFPPAGAVFLLVVERKSDFVRFHAWQSAMLFSLMFIIQMIFVWSEVMFWLIFCVDLGLMAFLMWRAYTDADTLDRFELPFIGALAARFVDDE